MACLEETTVLAFLRGTLDAAAVAAVEDEVDRCDSCRSLLAHAAKQTHADLVELAPDTEVGRYRIQHKLGAGAMGIVYAARDPVVHRLVALKLIPARTFRAPDGVLREARALGAVSHPAVVPIYSSAVSAMSGHSALPSVHHWTINVLATPI